MGKSSYYNKFHSCFLPVSLKTYFYYQLNLHFIQCIIYRVSFKTKMKINHFLAQRYFQKHFFFAVECFPCTHFPKQLAQKPDGQLTDSQGYLNTTNSMVWHINTIARRKKSRCEASPNMYSFVAFLS